MAKKYNFFEYTCDRCGKREYVPNGAQLANRWYQVSRFMANGTESDLWLCSNCYAEYQTLMEDQDTAYTTYMKEGKK